MSKPERGSVTITSFEGKASKASKFWLPFFLDPLDVANLSSPIETVELKSFLIDGILPPVLAYSILAYLISSST